MKKIIITLMLSFGILLFSKIVIANNSITVSAVVGNLNHSPVITSITPSGTQIFGASQLQNFSIKFSDNEKDHVYYTITTETNGGFTSPISGEIKSSDYLGNEAIINFRYLAPSTGVGTKKITITLNDGPNVISKDINLYIY